MDIAELHYFAYGTHPVTNFDGFKYAYYKGYRTFNHPELLIKNIYRDHRIFGLGSIKNDSVYRWAFEDPEKVFNDSKMRYKI